VLPAYRYGCAREWGQAGSDGEIWDEAAAEMV